MARWLKARGIVANGVKLRDMDEIARLYADGMTTLEIAVMTGATSSRVATALRERGVPMRPRGAKKNKIPKPESVAKAAAWRRENFKGENNPNWRGGRRKYEIYKERYGYQHKEWSKAVRERDGHTCQHCGITGVKLHAHHVKPWQHHPENRFDVSNGLTLCEPCHQKVHGHRFPWLNGENGTSAKQAAA